MAFNDPTWIDSLSLSGYEMRWVEAMMAASDGTAGGAVAGVRPGDIGLAVSLSGFNVTVAAGVAALYKSGQGIYRASNPTAWTGTINAAPTSPNSRIDLVYLRVWDNAVDSSGLFKADIVYLPGTAATSPVPPTRGASEIFIPLATITVPSSGSGNPSAQDTRPVFYAPGGIGVGTDILGTYAGQYRDIGTFQRYSGSAWQDRIPLAMNGQLVVGGSTSAGSVASANSTLTNYFLVAAAPGDASNRFAIDHSGATSWGPGNASRDTTLYRSAASTLKTDGALVVGGSLTVSGVGQWLPAVKGADTARASNTTVSADPDLSIALVSGATYLIDGWLQTTGGTTGSSDFKVTLAYTGTASVNQWTPYGPTTTSSTTTDQNGRAFGQPAAIGTYSTTTPVNSAPRGIITTTSAGNLQVQWAQNTSSATATTLKAGSWLRVERIA